jgi:hypothetical protein
MRHDVVFREITGWGYRSPNVPAQMMERSASFCEIRNKEERTGNDGMQRQTEQSV